MAFKATTDKHGNIVNRVMLPMTADHSNYGPTWRETPYERCDHRCADARRPVHDATDKERDKRMPKAAETAQQRAERLCDKCNGRCDWSQPSWQTDKSKSNLSARLPSPEQLVRDQLMAWGRQQVARRAKNQAGDAGQQHQTKNKPSAEHELVSRQQRAQKKYCEQPRKLLQLKSVQESTCQTPNRAHSFGPRTQVKQLCAETEPPQSSAQSKLCKLLPSTSNCVLATAAECTIARQSQEQQRRKEHAKLKAKQKSLELARMQAVLQQRDKCPSNAKSNGNRKSLSRAQHGLAIKEAHRSGKPIAQFMPQEQLKKEPHQMRRAKQTTLQTQRRPEHERHIRDGKPVESVKVYSGKGQTKRRKLKKPKRATVQQVKEKKKKKPKKKQTMPSMRLKRAKRWTHVRAMRRLNLKGQGMQRPRQLKSVKLSGKFIDCSPEARRWPKQYVAACGRESSEPGDLTAAEGRKQQQENLALLNELLAAEPHRLSDWFIAWLKEASLPPQFDLAHCVAPFDFAAREEACMEEARRACRYNIVVPVSAPESSGSDYCDSCDDLSELLLSEEELRARQLRKKKPLRTKLLPNLKTRRLDPKQQHDRDHQ